MESIAGDKFFIALEEKINDQYPEPLAAQLVAFSRKVFDLPALDELGEEPVEKVLKFLQDFLDFTKKIDLNSPKVKVYCPTTENCLGGTEIFIIQRDMPFLVDSVRIELNRRGLNIQTIISTILNVIRDDDGALISAFADPDEPNSCKEALIFLNVEFHGSSHEILHGSRHVTSHSTPHSISHSTLHGIGEVQQELANSIIDVLGDVEVVTDGFLPMAQRLEDAISEVRENQAGFPEEDVDEFVRFLQWMRTDALIFLGCSEYELTERNGTLLLEHNPERQLGLYAQHPVGVSEIVLADLNPNLHKLYNNGLAMAFTKSSLRARVHRQAYSDYIVLKRYGPQGKVVGEHLFMGLYTSRVYTMSPFQMPLIRQRVQAVLDRVGFPKGSHDYKAMCQLIEVHPRDELFNCSVDELYQALMAIWQMNERRLVRFFMRTDPFEKFVSCLVYMPRDIYKTSIREKIEALLKHELDASECEFNTYFSESILARTQFILRINSNAYLGINQRELEQHVIQLTRDWCDDLRDAAMTEWSEETGREMNMHYGNAFPASYQDHFSPSVAIDDINLFHPLVSDDEIAMRFYQEEEDDPNIMRFRVFRLGKTLELSNIVPMLENLGFRVLGEHPYEITPAYSDDIWLHDFKLKFGLEVDVDVSLVRDAFQEAFNAVWLGDAENDRFNHLVVGARLEWRTVALLRVYACYMKQLGSNFSQDFLAATLASNLDITRNLVALFHCLLDPKVVDQQSREHHIREHRRREQHSRGKNRADRLNDKIIESLDQVVNLNEDKVLRSYLQLINATKRTNFFQTDGDGEYKIYIAVKLATQELEDAPEPRPLYEIFVYSPRMEGVHLRLGKVARGGLRWSDRLEDYRTEVLGLVKAQQVKNAVIVPTGAKGGFVSKRLDRKATREEFLQEGFFCYQQFITGLLDITDNIVDDEVIPPDSVVCRDYEDPYFVVAADKGTATFSDVANQISSAHDYWLGDAFASGGSNGYDHKKMGITARGTWVSVQRHFRERGLNTQTDEITVLGIGDMSGDVFGNGLLMSKHIKLVAAFNHQHIFIDPNPDTSASFEERKRLFELQRSNWNDYDVSLISKGGGAFSRSAKSIELSPEAQQSLGISDAKLKPNDLIHLLLQAKVDLIWNGGIGTYVKAISESHQDVGDRTNDPVRVNGKDLRCQVFGEGGNLGMTQKGRIEFALNGGACNTDFIDNAAGVDCSDHEVNIKILLNELVRQKTLTREQRNELLEAMTENVAQLVLHNNYRQTQAISLAYDRCQTDFSEYWRFILARESAGQLNRELEALPDDEVLAEREKLSLGLTRPEISVLLSYGKMLLKDTVLASNIPEDQYVAKSITGAFPDQLLKQYPAQVEHHSLRREIITNQIVNEMINIMGLTYCQRKVASTGATVAEVVRAYVVVRDVLHLDRVWAQVEALDYKVPAEVQFELFHALMRLGRRTSRWMLRNRRSCLNPQQEVKDFSPKLVELQLLLPTLFSRQEDSNWMKEVDRFVSQGVQQNIAVLVASSNFLYFGFGIADIAISAGKPVGLVLELYHRISSELDLDWFADQIVSLEPSTRWEDFARESYVDDLENQRRSLTLILLSNVTSAKDIASVIEVWKAAQEPLIARWGEMTRELHATPNGDFAMFSVALRELLDIVQSTEIRPDSPPICLV